MYKKSTFKSLNQDRLGLQDVIHLNED